MMKKLLCALSIILGMGVMPVQAKEIPDFGTNTKEDELSVPVKTMKDYIVDPDNGGVDQWHTKADYVFYLLRIHHTEGLYYYYVLSKDFSVYDGRIQNRLRGTSIYLYDGKDKNVDLRILGKAKAPVKRIEKEAFVKTKAKTVILPATVTYCEPHAFGKNVTIKKSSLLKKAKDGSYQAYYKVNHHFYKPEALQSLRFKGKKRITLKAGQSFSLNYQVKVKGKYYPISLDQLSFEAPGLTIRKGKVTAQKAGVYSLNAFLKTQEYGKSSQVQVVVS